MFFHQVDEHMKEQAQELGRRMGEKCERDRKAITVKFEEEKRLHAPAHHAAQSSTPQLPLLNWQYQSAGQLQVKSDPMASSSLPQQQTVASPEESSPRATFASGITTHAAAAAASTSCSSSCSAQPCKMEIDEEVVTLSRSSASHALTAVPVSISVTNGELMRADQQSSSSTEPQDQLNDDLSTDNGAKLSTPATGSRPMCFEDDDDDEADMLLFSSNTQLNGGPTACAASAASAIATPAAAAVPIKIEHIISVKQEQAAVEAESLDWLREAEEDELPEEPQPLQQLFPVAAETATRAAATHLNGAAGFSDSMPPLEQPSISAASSAPSPVRVQLCSKPVADQAGQGDDNDVVIVGERIQPSTARKRKQRSSPLPSSSSVSRDSASSSDASDSSSDEEQSSSSDSEDSSSTSAASNSSGVEEMESSDDGEAELNCPPLPRIKEAAQRAAQREPQHKRLSKHKKQKVSHSSQPAPLSHRLGSVSSSQLRGRVAPGSISTAAITLKAGWRQRPSLAAGANARGHASHTSAASSSRSSGSHDRPHHAKFVRNMDESVSVALQRAVAEMRTGRNDLEATRINRTGKILVTQRVSLNLISSPQLISSPL